MTDWRRALSNTGNVIRRNPGLMWFVIIAVVLFALTRLPTPLRKNFWCAVDSFWVERTIYPRQKFIEANGNEDKNISLELGTDEVRRLLAGAAGYPVWRLEDLSITVDRNSWCSWDTSRNPPVGLARMIYLYAYARFDGHTAEYARAVLESVRSTPSKDMAFLSDVRNMPSTDIPNGIIPERYVSRVEKDMVHGSERVVGFVVIDGALAWEYSLVYDDTGSLKSDSVKLFDALEFDPKYAQLKEDVEREVEVRMGIKGIRGLSDRYRLKKELLRDEGYDWRSSAELSGGDYE